jgi:hypothetical protein
VNEQHLAVALLRAIERQYDEERAEQEERGADRHQGNLDDRLQHLAGGRIGPRLVGERPDQAPALVHQVVGDQGGEEHAFGPDEGPNGQLAAVQSSAGLDGVSRFHHVGVSHHLNSE